MPSGEKVTVQSQQQSQRFAYKEENATCNPANNVSYTRDAKTINWELKICKFSICLPSIQWIDLCGC